MVSWTTCICTEFACSTNQHLKTTIKKKSPETFAHLVNFSINVSATFDNHTILLLWLENKQTVHMLPFRGQVTWSPRTRCAKDPGFSLGQNGRVLCPVVLACTLLFLTSALWFSRLFLILVTHKSTSSENPIARILRCFFVSELSVQFLVLLWKMSTTFKTIRICTSSTSVSNCVDSVQKGSKRRLFLNPGLYRHYITVLYIAVIILYLHTEVGTSI